jgi:alpha/beta superfamily hydrolase
MIGGAMTPFTKTMIGLALLAPLAGCGGGGGQSSDGSGGDKPGASKLVIKPSGPRGSLAADVVAMGTWTPAQLDAAIARDALGGLATKARCSVVYRSVEYNTIGGKAEPTTATTALLTPSGSDPACQGARPLLMYAHGTSTVRSDNMADPNQTESAAHYFASQGYIVVVPNYTGYDRSKLAYHPYLVADAQSADVVDALRASREVLAGTGGTVSSKLFLTGYSQGGYVAMAAHRAIEKDYASEFSVTASAPLSGPYAMSNFAKAIFASGDAYYATVTVPMVITSYQKSYGNLYANPADMYNAPYASTIESLMPGAYDPHQLVSSGKVPAQLFDQGDGQPFLVKSAMRDAYRSSAPSTMRDAVVKNDLLNFKPKAPMALCGNTRDRMVFFSNSTDAVAYFATQGVTVPLYDLENRASLPAGAFGDAVQAQYKAAKAATPSEEAHVLSYVGCVALAAQFFQDK